MGNSYKIGYSRYVGPFLNIDIFINNFYLNQYTRTIVISSAVIFLLRIIQEREREREIKENRTLFSNITRVYKILNSNQYII
jgi:hypothetical protein